MNSFYLATLQPYVFCVVIYFTSGPQTIEETAENQQYTRNMLSFREDLGFNEHDLN